MGHIGTNKQNETLTFMMLKKDQNGKISNSESMKIQRYSPITSRSRRATEITKELLIEDHGPSFKQFETYFMNENITQTIVEAHNGFERNIFYQIHDLKMRVAVINNQ